MRFTFTVEVEVERTQGKFATRDELADQIKDALENASPGDLQGENEGEYTINDWTVDEVPQPKAQRKHKSVSETLADLGVKKVEQPSEFELADQIQKTLAEGAAAAVAEDEKVVEVERCVCGEPAVDRGRCANNYYYGQCGGPRPGQYMGD